jgi:D-amino-acid dehydrogenase
LKRLDVCIPLQPAKGYSLSYEQKRTVVTRPLMLDDARVVVTPLDKELRFSGLLDLGGFDEKLHRSRIKRIHRAINDFISIGSDILLAEKRWCGLRPCTPDGLPIISRAEAIPNLVIATGHAMLGMTLGPMSGKLAAEILACKPTTMNVSSLCLDRF